MAKELGGTKQALTCLGRKARPRMQGHSCMIPSLCGLQLSLTVSLPLALNQDRCGAFKNPKDEGLHLLGAISLLGMQSSLMSDLLPSSCSLHSCLLITLSVPRRVWLSNCPPRSCILLLANGFGSKGQRYLLA